MSAGFGNQHPGARSEAGNGFCTVCKCLDISFVAGKQYGKGSQQAFSRFVFVYIREGL